MLALWAKSADAAMAAKVAEMKAAIRDEVVNELLATPLARLGDPLAGMSAENRERVLKKFTLQDQPESVPAESEGPEA